MFLISFRLILFLSISCSRLVKIKSVFRRGKIFSRNRFAVAKGFFVIVKIHRYDFFICLRSFSPPCVD